MPWLITVTASSFPNRWTSKQQLRSSAPVSYVNVNQQEIVSFAENSMQTAFHAVDSSELTEGDWLAIVGAGGLGQIATQIAKARGVKVIAIDINDATLEVCKQQGADAVFNSKTNKNYAEELKQLTNGGCKAACVFSNAQAVSQTWKSNAHRLTGQGIRGCSINTPTWRSIDGSWLTA